LQSRQAYETLIKYLNKSFSGTLMNLKINNVSDNMLGSAYMLLAMASFAIGDSILKFISSEMPLGQILFTRGLFAIVILYIIARKLGSLRPLSAVLKTPFLLRVLGEVCATYFFFTALFQIPLANAAAIMQALPLTVTLAAAYFLGEAIGWRRISAILVGFIGVILIIQPGLDGFNIFSLYCLVAVLACTLRDVATRRLDHDTPTIFVTLVTVFVVAIGGGLLGLTEEWVPTTLYTTSILGVASLFLITGFIGIVSSMRVGEVAVVTPFRYSVLIFAILIGLIFFNELPNTLTIIGSIIVVGSGIYTIYRERRVAQKLAKSAVKI
jgi:S-adenosylmethionine uptake transporter